MDDIDNCIQDSKLIKFADDTKLYVTYSPLNPDCNTLLQDDLSRVSSWCSAWLLKLNSEKSSCVHFGFLNPKRDYFLEDNLIRSSNSVLDLGILISSDLKPSSHCSKAIGKAQKMLSVLKLAFKFLDVDAMTILYKTFVLPLLDYCCVAWCPFYIKDIDALEKVQRRFTKILPCFRDLTYEDRLLKYNLPSLFSRRLQFDIQCMFMIIHGYMDISPHDFFCLDDDLRTVSYTHLTLPTILLV